MKLFFRKLGLMLLALTLSSLSAFARGLSDLAIFANSPQQLEKTLTDPGQKREYRKALDSYGPKAAPLTKQFDAIFKQVRDLQAGVGGVKERLTSNRKSLSFNFNQGRNGNYRFERVNQPLNAILFLQNLHKNGSADTCNQRDELIVDKWTPMLKDASLFAVEKNGRYLGATLILVPVESGNAKYLLVVSSDSGSQIPDAMLEAFLRDYQKKVPNSLRFALLTKVPNQANEFLIERVENDGRRSGNLGSTKNFRLIDPMAQKIRASAPAYCAPANNSIASFPKDGGAGTKPSPDNINSNNNTVTYNNNNSVTSNVMNGDGKAAVKNGSGGSLGMQSGPGINVPNFQKDRVAGSGPVQDPKGNVTIINNGPQVRDEGPRRDRDSLGANVPKPSKFIPSFNGPSIPRTISSAENNSSPSLSLGGGNSQHGSQNVGIGPIAMGGGSKDGGGGGGGELTPADQRAKAAMDQANKDLDAGKPVPPATLKDPLRVGGASPNPEVKKEAEELSSKAFFMSKKADDALENYRNALGSMGKEESDDEVIALLLRDVCTHCKDCSYCKAVEKQNDLRINESMITR